LTFAQAKKSPHKDAGKQQVEGSNLGNYGQFERGFILCKLTWSNTKHHNAKN
jgi:hypothetical protein|tara:strand:+ start:317 stop:472 length:156 start_codon:yes stop_codon:yes gene_type:complete